MRRYKTRSTLMTSNRPLEDWGKLKGHVPSATAILDRFLHHAEVVAITGKSYRLRSQRRHGSPAADHNPEISEPAISPTGTSAGIKRKSNQESPPTLAPRSDLNDYQYQHTTRVPIPPDTGRIQSAR